MSKIGSLDPEIWAKKWSNRFSGSGVMVKIVTDLGATRYFMRGRYFLRKSREIWQLTDTEKMMMTNIIGNFVADNIVFEVSKIGPVDPEIWAEKWSKSGQIKVPERFFEKILRNMTDTEKMLISITVGNRIVRI